MNEMEQGISDLLAMYEKAVSENERLRELLKQRPVIRCGCCGNCPDDDSCRTRQEHHVDALLEKSDETLLRDGG